MLLTNALVGQEKVETKSLAEEYIYNLKNGATIVRLYMNKPKMDVLKKSINDPSLSKEKQVKLKKQLDDHVIERQDYVIKTIHAFDSIYDFSNVYYIYDYDQKRFTSGERSNIFVGIDGEIDNKRTMMEENYLFLGRGGNDESFVFFQPDGKPMPNSFPDRYSPNIIQGIVGIFYSDKLGRYIYKLNEKLHNYYNTVGVFD